MKGLPLIEDIADNWENVQRFQAREDDLLLVTYPKSGTTWISEIVDRMCRDTSDRETKDIFQRVPYLEFAMPGNTSGTELLDKQDFPRIIKTHLSAETLPLSFWEKNCKIIYVSRNVKDVAVSFYHFHRMATHLPESGSWEEFLEKFIKGNVEYGSWSDHVRSWWKRRQQRNILYLSYEDMLEDLRREIQKVMMFLGKDLSDEVLDDIQRHTTFSVMRENPMTNYSNAHRMDQTISPFMRKGICGDWKNHFTLAQRERFDEHYHKEMAGMDLTFHF
ncbi:unnamed protein product [Staurois parvus]|uniref:Sulfotransferase n=1 Tax=Staurois parvus TaxID=386267 RepID=A0ABN9CCX3_9NEOB|nr:unnamed protein product [Staurois parvus]